MKAALRGLFSTLKADSGHPYIGQPRAFTMRDNYILGYTIL